MPNVDEQFELDVIKVTAPAEDEQAETQAQAVTSSWPYSCKTTI